MFGNAEQRASTEPVVATFRDGGLFAFRSASLRVRGVRERLGPVRSRSAFLVLALAPVAFALLAPLLPGKLAWADAPSEAPRPGARTSALSWLRLEGADTCVSTQDLARAVEERLQRKVFVPPSEADLSIEAHVRLAQGRYRAVVTVRDAKGTQLGRRELDDSKCENLTDPLSLVIALMIDPEAATRKPLPTPAATAPDPAPAPTAPTAAASAPPDHPPLPPQPELHRDPPSDTAPVRSEIHLSGGLSLGRAMNVGPLLKISGWMKPLHFPGFAAGATYGFDESISVPTRTGAAEGRVGLMTAFGAVCPIAAGFWTPQKRGYVIACLGMEFGVLRTQGVGFDRNAENLRFLANAQLSVDLSVLIAGPLTFHFAPTAFVPLIRDDINYVAADGTDRLLFRMSRVGVSFEAGLGLRFP